MKNILVYLFLTFSVTTVHCQVINPNAIAKEYFTDLVTKDENTFVSKYMLTQADFLYLMNNNLRNHDLKEIELSDSLTIRSSVYKNVLQSYRDFKSSMESLAIPASSLTYLTCFYELEYENKDLRLLIFDELSIHFKSDTNYYAIHLDDLVLVNNHWIGGDVQRLIKTDSTYEEIYSDGINDYDYVGMDSVAVAAYDYSDSVDSSSKPYKKQQKLQKKIDAYYRKIDLLYQKH